MSKRRKARKYAVQFLYGFDINRQERDEALEDFWEANRASSEIRDFSTALINGTLDNVEELDKRIGEHSRNWNLSRIALVDKNILRIAVFELLFRADIPAPVTIDEAVELAKYFGTPDTARFVNGILDNIRKETADH